MTVAQWSTTASLNVLSSGTSGTGGTNIDEGMARSDVNNAMRDIMSQIATWRTAATIGGFFSQTVIGHTAALSIGGNSDNFEVFGTTAATGGVAIGMFNATAGTGPHLDFYRSKDAALATATVVASGDNLGALNWYGAQQTGTFATQTMAAQIRAEADGTVTSGAGGDMPGRLVFATTADSGSAVTDRLILDSSGRLKPNANDGVALGTATLSYADLFLADGGVINWNNSNYTLTHSTGTLTASGALTVAGASPFTATYVDAGAALGPTLDVYRDSASPAASDALGTVDFNGRDSAGNKQLYVRLSSAIQTATSTSEDGIFTVQTVAAGTLTTQMQFNATTLYIVNNIRLGQNTTDSPGAGNNTVGIGLGSGGAASLSAAAQTLSVNVTSDGILQVLRSGGTSQGTISVSGATITYGTFNGSHEAQLADGVDRSKLLCGTIMESVDEQCNWYGYPDRVLPKVKISDKAGSKRVYGVFFDWYDSNPKDDTANNSALGAYVIRIAKGETVQGGDLIESNGDGCGRVQADDIFRASTVAKITSTVVAETYPDGSYLLPCTLHCG